ncbi:HNH endonuclease [Micrococcales bacterium KH10]|nr:HNH endonuclease [Micrococcales bacterium KH10]
MLHVSYTLGDVADILAIDDEAVERYVDVLSAVSSSIENSNLERAVIELAPIADELWFGRFVRPARSPALDANTEIAKRAVSHQDRVNVFRRDCFLCLYCGKRTIPRCVLVAISDVFQDAFAYHPNYKRGALHPAFWLAPEADHVVAHARGGSSDPSNLVTLHAMCNLLKSDSPADDLPIIERPDRMVEWDGLLSKYAAIVAHGGGSQRAEYHRFWMRLYGVKPVA